LAGCPVPDGPPLGDQRIDQIVGQISQAMLDDDLAPEK
jgi:hypothetical protein